MELKIILLYDICNFVYNVGSDNDVRKKNI